MILFLDFDGVLHPTFGGGVFTQLDRFEALLREHPEVKVVLTTSWREIHTFEELQGFFSEDIRPRIIGKTPVIRQKEPVFLPHVRHREIRQWLQRHGALACNGHVIVDDFAAEFPEGCPELMLCDGDVGLDDEAARRLRRKIRDGRGGGMVVLFLDFDGVLHPAEVYRRGKEPYLRHDLLPPDLRDARLFMWADRLEVALAPYPKVRVVLSTSWVPVLGFDETRARLPEGLRARVIGATFHSSSRHWWDGLTRAEQILTWRPRRSAPAVKGWLAIDDLHGGDPNEMWPDHLRDRLVLTDPMGGLGDGLVLAKLQRMLERKHAE